MKRYRATASRTSLASQATRIIAELADGDVRQAQAVHRGVMTFKYSVETTAGERFVVRFYPPGRGNVIATEPALLGRCRDVGLPVPQVLAESRTGPAAHLPYIVYRWIEGDVLADRLRTLPVDRQDAVAAHLGELLSRFRGVVCEGFGELVDGTRAQERSWEDFLASSVALGLEAIARYDLLAPSLQERLRAALHQMRGLSPIGESTLVWGDVSFENVLIGQDDRVAGLIDFESCLSGDPLATLGFCYAAQGNHPFCSRLLSASPEAAGASARQRVALYAVLRLLRLAPHAHQALPTGYPRDDLIDIFPGFLPALSELTA